MTTIGYGDIDPVTPIGKVLGGIVAMFGIACFALPSAILVGGIMEELQRTRETTTAPAGHMACPRCGGTGVTRRGS